MVVGKGITYDTGGLIKPREAMVPMKTDMTGAAVALATVLARPGGVAAPRWPSCRSPRTGGRRLLPPR